ncbi:MAG: hypothetical protein PUI29_09390 [Aeromonadales bacterium]|nr:hypothetical protein [Aeromonadales bacterium]
MIWIFTVFNEHLLYDVLLAIYQLSWTLTLPFIIVIYLKSPLARGLESKPRPEAGGSGESGAQEARLKKPGQAA